MKAIRILQVVPPFMGILLFLVAGFDSWQFGRGMIDPHTMLGREIPIATLGFVFTGILVIATIVFAFKRDPANAAISFLSALSFLALFGLGGIFTPAYMFAT